MAWRGVFLYVLLGCDFIGVGSVCVPRWCLRCNVTEETSADSCPLCSNSTAQCINDTAPTCIKDFQVSVNSTGSKVEEGNDITLTCDHNIPSLNVMFGWKKDKEEIQEGRNTSTLALEKVFAHDGGQYTCFVKSPCGIYASSPHGVTVNNNNMILLMICGVSALALVIIMGLAMKYTLKRSNAKHKERMKQRAQMEQSGGPAPYTLRQT